MQLDRFHSCIVSAVASSPSVNIASLTGLRRRESSRRMAVMAVLNRETYTLEITEGGHLKAKLFANLNEDNARAFKEDIATTTTGIRWKVDGLLDIGNFTELHPGCVKVFIEIAKMDIWNKIAVYGGTPLGRVAAKTVVKLINLDHVRMFGDYDEAMQWLFKTPPEK